MNKKHVNLLGLLTPINLVKEKNHFFSSRTYDPIFKYEWSDKNINLITENSKKKDLFKAILSGDNDLIVKKASEFYESTIDDEVITLAKRYVKEIPQKIDVDVAKIKIAFEKSFKNLGFKYELEITKKGGFNFRPNYKEKKLIFSKHAQLEFFSIDGMVKHEMAHIIRFENGKYNDISNDDNYLPTEEGLASYLHDFKSEGRNESLYQHAIEYLGTQIALEGSLRDLYFFFLDAGFSPENAWNRSARHKFGFVDTSKGGDLMKPSMYFFNELKVKKLSHEQIIRLFVGKISMNNISKYKHYKGIVPKDKLLEYYKLN